MISEAELKRLIFNNHTSLYLINDDDQSKIYILDFNSERHRNLLYREAMELVTKHKSISWFFTFSSHLVLLKTGQDGSLEKWLGWAEPYRTISEWTRTTYINCYMYSYPFRKCKIVFKWELDLYLVNIALVREFHAFTGSRNTVRLGKTKHF